MKFTATKTFNLLPIGNIRFCFHNRKSKKFTNISVESINIFHDTDIGISDEVETALMKEMEVSDLLTDGREFWTTRGNKITRIAHPYFNEVLEEEKDRVRKYFYG